MSMDPGGTYFQEAYIEADGFRIRYSEAGRGAPLVVLHGDDGMKHYTSHDLLAHSRRVLLFEVPGFGRSPRNERSQSKPELANTLAQAVTNLGISMFDLCGTSFGGNLALWLAVQHPSAVRALMLVSPAAIRSASQGPSSPGEFRIYAHPERLPEQEAVAPEDVEKQRSLIRRLESPGRDLELERRMAELDIPVLVVFGTEDAVVPSSAWHHYKELLPQCNLVLLYDAGHEADADRPDAFASLASDFLERHSAFVINQATHLINP